MAEIISFKDYLEREKNLNTINEADEVENEVSSDDLDGASENENDTADKPKNTKSKGNNKTENSGTGSAQYISLAAFNVPTNGLDDQTRINVWKNQIQILKNSINNFSAMFKGDKTWTQPQTIPDLKTTDNYSSNKNNGFCVRSGSTNTMNNFTLNGIRSKFESAYNKHLEDNASKIKSLRMQEKLNADIKDGNERQVMRRANRLIKTNPTLAKEIDDNTTHPNAQPAKCFESIDEETLNEFLIDKDKLKSRMMGLKSNSSILAGNFSNSMPGNVIQTLKKNGENIFDLNNGASDWIQKTTGEYERRGQIIHDRAKKNIEKLLANTEKKVNEYASYSKFLKTPAYSKVNEIESEIAYALSQYRNTEYDLNRLLNQYNNTLQEVYKKLTNTTAAEQDYNSKVKTAIYKNAYANSEKKKGEEAEHNSVQNAKGESEAPIVRAQQDNAESNKQVRDQINTEKFKENKEEQKAKEDKFTDFVGNHFLPLLNKLDDISELKVEAKNILAKKDEADSEDLKAINMMLQLTLPNLLGKSEIENIKNNPFDVDVSKKTGRNLFELYKKYPDNKDQLQLNIKALLQKFTNENTKSFKAHQILNKSFKKAQETLQTMANKVIPRERFKNKEEDKVTGTNGNRAREFAKDFDEEPKSIFDYALQKAKKNVE